MDMAMRNVALARQTLSILAVYTTGLWDRWYGMFRSDGSV
jgi:hypothetical protein